ncbi:MAG: sulfite exporter TauE/SafE family protein [Proteobacteria bacterium]|nr:sulfite exporter TauE/SafE family protein [Pseudomonadota bacterium]
MGLDPTQLGLLLGALLGAGLFAGLIAGLFGVGGGTVIVPALYYAFAALELGGEGNLHTAVGSSLAVIIATALRSLGAHRRAGAVDEALLRAWTPWVALGALIGAMLAAFFSEGGLSLIYAAVVLIVAAQMGLGRESWRLRSDLPTGQLRAALGALIGALSALMGVGGGALGGMLMTLCGRPIHQAVATASGFGVGIAVPAALGFVVAGWGAEGRPPLSLGYVNVPAALVMALVTTATAPFGARLAHRLPRRTLRRCFAVFLVFTAATIVAKALN